MDKVFNCVDFRPDRVAELRYCLDLPADSPDFFLNVVLGLHNPVSLLGDRLTGALELLSDALYRLHVLFQLINITSHLAESRQTCRNLPHFFISYFYSSEVMLRVSRKEGDPN